MLRVRETSCRHLNWSFKVSRDLPGLQKEQGYPMQLEHEFGGHGVMKCMAHKFDEIPGLGDRTGEMGLCVGQGCEVPRSFDLTPQEF